MLLFVLHELWSIIDDSVAVVSSVVPSYPALLSFHMLAGHLDRARVIIAHWINNEKKPFGDPGVRRAMHLVLDRHALTELVKDVSPSLLGGFLYPFSEYATPTAELVERLGYRRDTTASVQE